MYSGIVVKVLGKILLLQSVFLLPSLALALIYRQDDLEAFAITFIVTALVGFLLSKIISTNKKIKAKEGLAIVTFGWVLVSIFGALPFYLSGYVPNYIDALFETVSGLTTTGATILTDIEVLPKGLLFWRSFTHWIGGMGILVFTLALLPSIGVGVFQIYKAESPGPAPDKIVPRLKDTAKILYTTYISLTLLLVVLLMLGGMDWYESFLHAFATLGTGGFSSRNASIGAFNSSYIHVVITIFMILAGTNFSLYYALYRKKWRDILGNAELKFYIGAMISASLLITVNLLMTSYNHAGMALRDSFFQVAAITTTTGYATVDFDQWATFSKMILFFLMFLGGCAGSTGGSIKVIRILALLKLVKREVVKIFHPRAMIPVKIGHKPLASDTLASITSFIALYVALFVVGTVIISLEGISMVSAASTIAATLGNVGPGFEAVGPTQNYSGFSNFTKMFLSVYMLLGRLELFTIIALIAPRTWQNEA